VYWGISNPAFNNYTALSYNQSVHVYLERNYTQGWNKIEVTANVSKFVDRLTDVFDVRPLQIADFQLLKETQASSVFEIMVLNNLNTSQKFNWTINTSAQIRAGYANVTGYSFVYVETNYSSSGIYKTSVYVNRSSYNDSQNGVAVI
jgi:hypothetical protein